jgi:hypothetical protein
VDQLELERPQLRFLPRWQLLERRLAQLVLVELGADHVHRQQPAVDHGRHAELAQHVGERSDVVLVAVGEHDRLDLAAALAQRGEVGEHQVDAQHVGRRKHQPGIDDHDPSLALEDGHVLSDLPQAPQGDDANG